MSYELLLEFLKWSTIINVGVLLWWSFWIMFAGDFVYRIHSKWFEMDRKDFNKLHYTGMAFHKILIIFFNVIPWIVLTMID